MTVAHFGYLAALVLLAGCVSVVVALLVLRVGKDRAERRHARLRAPVWRHVMVLSTGEPDEVDEAFVRLLATDARERAVMLADAFALVPKLRGSARTGSARCSVTGGRWTTPCGAPAAGAGSSGAVATTDSACSRNPPCATSC